MRLENDFATVANMQMQVSSMETLVSNLELVLHQIKVGTAPGVKGMPGIAPVAYGNGFPEAVGIHKTTDAVQQQVTLMVERLGQQIEAMKLTIEMTKQRTTGVDQDAANRFIYLHQSDQNAAQR